MVQQLKLQEYVIQIAMISNKNKLLIVLFLLVSITIATVPIVSFREISNTNWKEFMNTGMFIKYIIDTITRTIALLSVQILILFLLKKNRE